ncbi:MAG: DUF4390 domain-containing protein [Marinicellaceae bacterium]
MIGVSCVIQAKNKVTNLIITSDKQNIYVTPELEFTTSKEIKEAIDNGIRVQLIVKAQLYEPVSWWFDKQISSEFIQLEISYYVLGKYYVVKNKSTDQRIDNIAYNRLWKELPKLINITLPKNQSSNPWVKLRIELDKGSLPTAMQIPVLFDENWSIDTTWHVQKVSLDD